MTYCTSTLTRTKTIMGKIVEQNSYTCRLEAGHDCRHAGSEWNPTYWDLTEAERA